MSLVYLTATDHINKQPYLCVVPAYYGAVGDAVMSGEVAPIFSPVDRHAPQRAQLPIKDMVTMYNTGVGFSLVHERDVATILHHIDAYLEEVQPNAEAMPSIQAYLKKIMPLRDRFYTLFMRVLNRHPELKKAYTGERENNIIKLLNDMMAVGGPVDLLGKPARPTSALIKSSDPNAPISMLYNA